MSKGSLFWGNAKGKLGETVFYRAGGEQRNRTYIKAVKNPKTLAQMENRLSMANFSAVYRALQPIIKESFPTRPSNQSGFNAFMSANKGRSSAVISAGIASAGLSVPLDMLISKGSIGIDAALKYGQIPAAAGAGYAFLSGIQVAVEGEAPVAINTADALVAAMQLQGANPYALPQNIKVTVVLAEYQDDGFAIKFGQLESANASGANAVLNLATSYGIALAAVPNGDGTGVLAVAADSVSAGADLMAAIIISYTDGNGKLQVTTSRIVSSDPTDETVKQFLPGGAVWNDVLAELGYNADGYLTTTSSAVTTPSGEGGGGGAVVSPVVSSATVAGIAVVSASDGTKSFTTGAKDVTINGSNLDTVETFTVVAGGTSYPVTVTSNDGSAVAGTINVGTAKTGITSIAIKGDGVTLLSATYSASGSGGDDSNPL